MKYLLRLTIFILVVFLVLPAPLTAAGSMNGKKAQGAAAPLLDCKISVTPDSFAVPLYEGDSSAQILTIKNIGVTDPLAYTIVLATPVLPARAKLLKPPESGSGETMTVTPGTRRPSGAIGRVLVLGDGSTESDISAALTTAGYDVVDTTLASAYTGTNPLASDFNAVVLLDDSHGATDMATSGQDSLVAFVNGGGGLLTTGWFPYQIAMGRYADMSSLLLVPRSYGIVNPETLLVVQPHPITSGMPDSTIFTTGMTVGTATKGTVLMHGNQSGDAVVAEGIGAGKVVQYLFTGDYSGWHPFKNSGVQTLLVNTINWFNVAHWLSANPLAGSINVGDSVNIDLKILTTLLPLGDYWKDVQINSDDPATPLVSVRVHLTVNAVVPIQLASFSGSEAASGVTLSWATFSEVNNYGFYVERRDGRVGQYKTVSALIPGAGTSLERHDYAWTDAKVSGGEYFYRLRQVDLNGAQQYSSEIVVRVTGVLGVKNESAPRVFALSQNYPNPFNPTTSVKFSVAQSEHATLKVYDVLGQVVMNLFDGEAEPGRYYQVGFDATSLPSGIYYYRLTTASRSDVKKMMLLK